MSTISWIVILLGIAATLLFLAGFVRGLNQAIVTRDDPTATEEQDNSGHLWTAIFAVIASAVVITAVGITPLAIYAGPLLCIFTAAAVGLAFFVDRSAPRKD